MTVLQRLLWLIVVVEVLVGTALVAARLGDPQPPLPELSDLDSLTRADLETVRNDAIHGSLQQWLTLAQAYLGQGFYAEAAQCYQVAAERDPRNQETVYGLAFALERTGRMEEAIPRFVQAAQLSNDELSVTCRYQVGRCHLRLEQLAEAEQAFGQVAEFPAAGYHLARLFVRTGRADAAIPLIERLLRALPQSHKLMQVRASAAEALGDQPTAERYRDLILRTPAGLELDYASSFFSLYGGRYGLPNQLQRCLALDGRLPQLRLNCLRRGLDVIRAEDLEQYDKVYVQAAELAMAQQQPDQALAFLDELAAIEAESQASVELRGDAHWLAGERDAAAAAWSRSLRLLPTARVHSKLAKFFEQPSETEQAASHAALAHQLAGMDAYYENQIEEAAAHFELARELDGENARTWYFLGEVRRLRGQSQDARAAYERCLELDPHYERARIAAARLATPVRNSDAGT